MVRHLRRRLLPAAAWFEVYVHLRSVDPARNRDRGYTLTWCPALLGDGALVRAWGRTGGAEQTRTEYYPDRAAAQDHIAAILRQRLCHGYRIVTWQ